MRGIGMLITVAAMLSGSLLMAQEPKKEEPKKEEKKPDVGLKASFKDGIRYKSEDGNFEAHLGGRYQENFRLVENFPDSATFARQTGFYSRAARLEVDGTFFKDWEFKVQGDFGLGTAVLQDGFIGFKRWKEFSIRVGQFKEPFSTEQLASLLWFPMAERVVGDRLVPSRDLGIMAHGKLFDDILGYQIAVFNGEGLNKSSQTADVEQAKDVALRLEAWPFKTMEDFPLKGIRLGVAGTYGEHTDAAMADILTRQTDTRVVDMDGSTKLMGKQFRLGFDFQVPFQSFGLEFEWFSISRELAEGSVTERIPFTQWYTTLTWMVTGEVLKFGQRVRPAKNFLDDGGLGAIQLAARFGRFTVDDAIVTKGFTPAASATSNTTTTSVSELSLAANWYPNPNLRVTLCLLHNIYGDDLVGAGKSIGNETAAIFRFQVDF